MEQKKEAEDKVGPYLKEVLALMEVAAPNLNAMAKLIRKEEEAQAVEGVRPSKNMVHIVGHLICALVESFDLLHAFVGGAEKLKAKTKEEKHGNPDLQDTSR